MNFISIHKMKLTRNISPNKEVLIQRWQRQLIDRTHINFQEFLHLLRQHVCMNSQISFLLFRFLFNIYETWSFLLFFFSQLLLETFFCLFDRDSSGLLSESEWIGSVYKLTEYVIHDILIYFVSTNIWLYTFLLTGYPIAQNMFEHSNHLYVLLDIYRMDMIRFQ